MKTTIKPLSILCLFGLVAALLGACAPAEHRRATGEYIDDTALNARVKTALLRDEVVGGFDVSTTTYDRVVQLSGFVDNEEERQRAAEVAADVQGVDRVVNNLSLKETRIYGDPDRQDEEQPRQQERRSPEDPAEIEDHQRDQADEPQARDDDWE